MSFAINSACSAVNIGMYFGLGHHWYSLAAGIFCGALAIHSLVKGI